MPYRNPEEVVRFAYEKSDPHVWLREQVGIPAAACALAFVFEVVRRILEHKTGLHVIGGEIVHGGGVILAYFILMSASSIVELIKDAIPKEYRQHKTCSDAERCINRQIVPVILIGYAAVIVIPMLSDVASAVQSGPGSDVSNEVQLLCLISNALFIVLATIIGLRAIRLAQISAIEYVHALDASQGAGVE